VARKSAGLLLYRRRASGVEVLIAHMGGPLWASREARAWSIVKGEYEEGEEPLAAARREFREETGAEPPDGPALELGEVRQSGGKRVLAWAIEGDFDPAALRPGTFTMQWPPHSGQMQEFPEIDRVRWCETAIARELLVAGQIALLDRFEELLALDS
jgi:predicted NUDIX family NTP pyrophosphohydrolase